MINSIILSPYIDMSILLDPNPDGYPPIVFIHGLGTSKESWQFQIRPFTQLNLRPIAFDIPGFGESLNPSYAWKISTVANDLAMEISSVTGVPVFLVGLSLGGCITLQIMLDHPEIVRAAILVNTFATIKYVGFSELFYFFKRIISILFLGMEKQADIVAHRVFPKPEQEVYRQMVIQGIVASDPIIYQKAMVELFRMDLTARLSAISQPTLIITGKDDTTVPKGSQAKLATSIPNSRHIVIQDSGHATPVDQPGVFNEAVLDFISQHTSHDQLKMRARAGSP